MKNKKQGTASVVIKGKGNYTGSLTLTFKIKKKQLKSLEIISIFGIDKDKHITGLLGVSFVDGGYQLVEGEDYTLTIKPNKDGTKTHIYKGIGLYGGQYTITVIK